MIKIYKGDEYVAYFDEDNKLNNINKDWSYLEITYKFRGETVKHTDVMYYTIGYDNETRHTFLAKEVRGQVFMKKVINGDDLTYFSNNPHMIRYQNRSISKIGETKMLIEKPFYKLALIFPLFLFGSDDWSYQWEDYETDWKKMERR